jgi:hypothetical protein
MNASATSTSAASVAQAASERVNRHHLLDRIYHALMAACVLTLMGSAFLPIPKSRDPPDDTRPKNRESETNPSRARKTVVQEASLSSTVPSGDTGKPSPM